MGQNCSCLWPQKKSIEAQNTYSFPIVATYNASDKNVKPRVKALNNHKALSDYNTTGNLKKIMRVQAFYRMHLIKSQLSSLMIKQNGHTSRIYTKMMNLFKTNHVIQSKAINLDEEILSIKKSPQSAEYGLIFYNKIIVFEKSFYIGFTNVLGNKHFKGALLCSDGKIYIGHWDQNAFTGLGKYVNKEASVYEGYFLLGKLEGKGKLTKVNNYVYNGHFRNGLFDGYGEEENEEYSYKGGFLDNKKNGKGILVNKRTNDVYEGDFLDNQITGVGKYVWASKDFYIGSFINGNMHGYGEYSWITGGYYKGEYKNNIREGKGQFKYPNNNIFEGNFINGKPEGKGKLIKGGIPQEVEFVNGIQID